MSADGSPKCMIVCKLKLAVRVSLCALPTSSTCMHKCVRTALVTQAVLNPTSSTSSSGSDYSCAPTLVHACAATWVHAMLVCSAS